MALRKNKLVRAALLVGLAAGTAIMTGCTLWKSMDGAERVPEESFSLKGAGVQLSRGTVNMGMCWLEIPYNMEKEVQKADDNALSFALAGASGAVFGTVQGANRIVGGVFEILFSPFPPYGPIMCPGWGCILKVLPEMWLIGPGGTQILRKRGLLTWRRSQGAVRLWPRWNWR